jgi:hypothetical protein
MKRFLKIFFVFLLITQSAIATKPAWGFWAHQRINRLAVFTLPPEMLLFYKKHIAIITDNAVNPDKRRYAVDGEAARHYIDIDVYPDSVAKRLPIFWNDAVKIYSEDSLSKHGIVPWAIQQYKFRLTEAFRAKNIQQILRLSADLGHYIADANVPLHTTRNYNGQLTGQEGIHAFWESRLPELYADEYDFFVGPATYEPKVGVRAWQTVWQAHAALDSVLKFEKQISAKYNESQKYVIEERGTSLVKMYSREFADKYHQLLAKQVERQMRASIKMIGDLWLTSWIDAGQPDLEKLATENLSEQSKKEDENEQQGRLKRLFNVRTEGENE